MGGGGACAFCTTQPQHPMSFIFRYGSCKKSLPENGCDIEMLQKGLFSIVFKGCFKKGVAAKRRQN